MLKIAACACNQPCSASRSEGMLEMLKQAINSVCDDDASKAVHKGCITEALIWDRHIWWLAGSSADSKL